MTHNADERQMLEELVAAPGGRISYKGRSPSEMQHLADVARVLDAAGMVSYKPHFVRVNPDLVLVEITDEGREKLRRGR